MHEETSKLAQRVHAAAENGLKNERSIGPLELFIYMQFLHYRALDSWQKGHPAYKVLEQHIQVGPKKFAQVTEIFQAWARDRGLVPMEVPYLSKTRNGSQALQVTADGDPAKEKFYCTRYAPENLPPKEAQRMKEKLNKPPELVVFINTSKEGECSECGTELGSGDFAFKEADKRLCMQCADLDHLVFLPAGDATLSRRSKKHSKLWAVVVKFSRARKRYERQGLLVESDALTQAEKECAKDATERAEKRKSSAILRAVHDKEFIAELTPAIKSLFPGCPDEEAQRIALHTGERGSGRVGRSAAAREFEPKTLELAVRAHIRHEHTQYDELLMSGVERDTARTRVLEAIQQVMQRWRDGSSAQPA